MPQLWKWNDDEGETEQGSKTKITWEEASKMNESPTVGDYAQKSAAVEKTSPSSPAADEDEDWMNLDNDRSESEKSKKKKASKKKK